MSKTISVIDFETDPFLYDRVPKVFAGGYFDGSEYVDWWGADTPEKVAQFLEDRNEICYAHNGGKFDFHFLLEYADSIKLINGRIAKMEIGRCELRDSWLILPLALKYHDKDTEFDYQKMEASRRDKFKPEIMRYLRRDCVSLYEWVNSFIDQFGRQFTIAGTAFSELKKLGFVIPETSGDQDEKFRPYYMGGRVEAIETGHFRNVRYFDINSAYPRAMLDQHPISLRDVICGGANSKKSGQLPRRKNLPYFARIIANSKGALPYRDAEGRLTFPRDNESRVYHATSWEIQAGLDTGTLKIEHVLETYCFTQTANFRPYVEKFFKMKAEAKDAGDKDKELFAKLLLNSCYGRFGLNPRNFKEYSLTDYGDYPEGEYEDWELLCDTGPGRSIWQRPAPGQRFFCVATAASITGWVRAYLWRALCASRGAVYCDTDSIMAKAAKIEIGKEVGQWHRECTFSDLWVYGKKMYAGSTEAGEWKSASKGCQLKPQDIVDLVENRVQGIEWRNYAPAFSVKIPCEKAKFTKRYIPARVA